MTIPQVFDKNKDGFITVDEIRVTMDDLGVILTDDDLKEMMDAADINHDGRLDYKGQPFKINI